MTDETMSDTIWRPLREDEHPFFSVGTGCGRSGEACCPEFDVFAPYEIVFVPGLGRVAMQGEHVLITTHVPHQCACGRAVDETELKYRLMQ